ncbi:MULTISPECIES: aldo/keto reductase [unclassified Nitrospina]|uniref:aldo/keto reductase n=1 Tax=unclassified Nitrospina TaxID=2638683 RepID=UPI003F9920B2
MEYRQLGSSDLKVSVLGFGAWGIGGSPFWTTEGDRASEKALLKAVELGINFFDTAPVYGFGHSESIIGKTLKPHRDKLVYATKCGLRWEKESLGSIRKVATRASIEEEVELSLKRLQTDVIDLYQVHWPDVDTPQAETMEALMRLKEQGKIRHIGVSNYNVRQMQECLEVGPIVSLQPEYSLLQRSIEKEIVPFCLVNGMGVVAYSPLASGVLTGKYGKDTRFKDWRSKGIIGEFTGEAFERNVEKVEQMKAVAGELGKTCTHVAINWVTRQPAVATALIGVKNEKQVEENVQAIGWELDKDAGKRLDRIFTIQ